MVDLHVHTNCSDGEFDVISVLKKAEQRDIKYLSITDHDSVMAYKQIEGFDIKQYYTGTLINGIELSFLYNDTIMEMLGYGIDIDIINEFEYVRKIRITGRVQIQSEILKSLKMVCDRIDIKYSEDLKINGAGCEANDVLLDDIIQYPENKEMLDKMGIVDRGTFFRNHFCNSASPFYINAKEGLPTINEVCKAIKDANGKCFLAHIFEYRLANPEQILQEIIDLRILDGVECYHRDHTTKQAEYIEDVCSKNNLLVSGGSDFHRETALLGHWNKNQNKIPDSIIGNLI